MKYKEGYEEFGSKVKQKKLLDSIESSNRILKGEASYEGERVKLDKRQVIYIYTYIYIIEFYIIIYYKNTQPTVVNNSNKDKKDMSVLHKKITKDVLNHEKTMKNDDANGEQDNKNKGNSNKTHNDQVNKSNKNNTITKNKEIIDNKVFERKITRLLQKTMNSTKKKILKTNKKLINSNKSIGNYEINAPISNRKSVEIYIESTKFEKVCIEIDEKPENNIEKEQNIIIFPSKPQKSFEYDEKSLDFKQILKDLWYFLQEDEVEVEYSNIELFQKNLQCLLKRISREFSELKLEAETVYKSHDDKPLHIYSQGYGSFLSGLLHLLNYRQNTNVYKENFESLHQDLIELFEKMKNFLYYKYLRPETPMRKSSKHLSSFEGYNKECFSDKGGKLSGELCTEKDPAVFKKKFCLNMAKALQSVYNIEKENSKQFSLKIHSMLIKKSNEQNNGIKLLKILKVNYRNYIFYKYFIQNKEIIANNEEELLKYVETRLISF